MSRTNISVLLATGLLGVLLWIVISMARDMANAPDELLPRPSEPLVIEFDPSLPHLSSRTDLENWLRAEGYQAGPSIENYREWLQELGFRQYSSLLGNNGRLPAEESNADQDDATLLILVGRGDIGATQTLAERSLESDPLAALEWFDQAAVNGSVFAMIRVADLLTTLSSPELIAFNSNPAWQAALEEVQNGSPPPRERALAWSIAAVTVGGFAIMDQVHAQRISALSADMDAAQIQIACDTAQTYVLETATARRASGGAVFSTEPPLFAISVEKPDQVIPCDVPVLPLVSLNHCAQQDFVGPANTLMTAWLCPEDE